MLRLATRRPPPSAAGVVRHSLTELFDVRLASFEVPPGHADDVAEAGRELAAHANTCEPGTRFLAILRDEERAERFVYVAVFDDPKAERAHRASPPARRFARVLLAAGVRLQSGRWTAVGGV